MTGLLPSEYECGLCYAVFRGLRLFDKHQDRNYKRRPAIICREPSTLGLVLNQRGTWTTPEEFEARKKSVEAMNSARSAASGRA